MDLFPGVYAIPMGTEKPGWHKEIVRFILDYTRDKGFPPTVAEIGEAMGLSSTSSVSHHIDVMTARGYLSRRRYSPRTLVVTDRGRELL
jgi:repressor LexA